ncbi:hypothetical protein MKX03_030714 [Papaver bracteatum]|nr:hypothetical protein MKX03_030714 [Papaver bracteatum]
MEEDGELDRATKEIDLLFNQLQFLKQIAQSFDGVLEDKILELLHISKDPKVQEHVVKYIQTFQNQLIKIKRVGQLVELETKEEADLRKKITSFIHIQKLKEPTLLSEQLQRTKVLEDKLAKEEEKVSDLATNFGKCQSTMLELTAKFDQIASVDLVNGVTQVRILYI